jgi:hypothetical protein
LWRDGPAHGQVASFYESCQTSLQCSAVEHDVSLAFPAAQADVGSEPVDQPLLSSTGVNASQRHDIAEPKLHDTRLFGGHYDCPN